MRKEKKETFEKKSTFYNKINNNPTIQINRFITWKYKQFKCTKVP